MIMKTLLTLVLAFGLTATSALAEAPKTVIHFITVAFKAEAKPEQIQAALEGAQKLPSQYKGILRVWTKAIKVQNIDEAKVKKTHVIAMEFANEAALKAYADSEAQKQWYELYLPIREQSTTFDVTN
jgi:antibiotic biosynthesis monooxygenase (ABM) superfamily enzyme